MLLLLYYIVLSVLTIKFEFGHIKACFVNVLATFSFSILEIENISQKVGDRFSPITKCSLSYRNVTLDLRPTYV